MGLRARRAVREIRGVHWVEPLLVVAVDEKSTATTGSDRQRSRPGSEIHGFPVQLRRAAVRPALGTRDAQVHRTNPVLTDFDIIAVFVDDGLRDAVE